MTSMNFRKAILVLLSITVQYAFGADLIPKKIQQLGIGMESSEIGRAFPNAEVMIEDNKEQSKLLLVRLPPSEIWDSAIFDIVKGKIAKISLLRGVTKRPEAEQGREFIVREALGTYGNGFAKKVALTSEKRPQAVFIWKLKELCIYLAVDIPMHPGIGDKDRIQLTIAPVTQGINELFHLPTPQELEIVTFDWLMEDVTRKMAAK